MFTKTQTKTKTKVPNPQNTHLPVLLGEVLEYLDPQPGESYLDATAGYGGHAAAILERTKGQATLMDRDSNAVAYLAEQFKGKPVEIIREDFLAASRKILAEGRRYDLILADIGLSSPHLNTASRGFAIQKDGPLDMRMDQEQQLSADRIVNAYSEAQLVKILSEYGEEPKARTIARMIVQNRPLHSTTELAKIVAKAWPKGRSKIHPATRTFQALRIAVNDELVQLEKAIPLWLDLLEPGGRIAIISFHSLEDRVVKQALADVSGNRYDASFHLLTKSPVTGSTNEIVSNPRARSAKLRAAAKIKNQKKGVL
jgi:16S rRNA (cytosine1402-N4)-methyltransferase